MSSVFDRIGILSPVVLRAKLIMQQPYRIPKMRWDDQVPPDIVKSVKEWSKDIKGLERISIPRRYGTDETKENQAIVHTFSDASGVA